LEVRPHNTSLKRYDNQFCGVCNADDSLSSYCRNKRAQCPLLTELAALPDEQPELAPIAAGL
jgi:hypothetical protein